jgi:hypothetical protein
MKRFATEFGRLAAGLLAFYVVKEILGEQYYGRIAL